VLTLHVRPRILGNEGRRSPRTVPLERSYKLIRSSSMRAVLHACLLVTTQGLLVGTPAPACACRTAQPTMLAPQQQITVTLTGCGSGVGVGLDKLNYVDMLTPGKPAEKGLTLGDKITHWNGNSLWVDGAQVKLKEVYTAAETHTLSVDRFGPAHSNVI
jgi:hypothetical protein